MGLYVSPQMVTRIFVVVHLCALFNGVNLSVGLPLCVWTFMRDLSFCLKVGRFDHVDGIRTVLRGHSHCISHGSEKGVSLIWRRLGHLGAVQLMIHSQFCWTCWAPFFPPSAQKKLGKALVECSVRSSFLWPFPGSLSTGWPFFQGLTYVDILWCCTHLSTRSPGTFSKKIAQFSVNSVTCSGGDVDQAMLFHVALVHSEVIHFLKPSTGGGFRPQ